MMTPEHRLAAVLAGSAVLSLPAMSAMLSGEIEPSAVGVRYGIAVAVVWAAIRLVERMIDTYGAGATDESAAGADPADVETTTHDRRRAEDHARSVASRNDVPATSEDGDESG